jgi:hypothetical protein
MSGHVSRVGDRRGKCNFLVGISELKRQHGRSKYRWKDNIKSVGKALNWIDLS